MKYENKPVILVKRLLAATDAGQLEWQRKDRENIFTASLSESIGVFLKYSEGERESDYTITLTLLARGKEIESYTDDDLVDWGVEGIAPLFYKLYAIARRRALGIEAVMDAALAALPTVKDEEDIRIRKDDDIPF